MFQRAAFRGAARMASRRGTLPMSSYANFTMPNMSYTFTAPPAPPVASLASTLSIDTGNTSLANIVAAALAQQETTEEGEAEPYVQASDTDDLDDT